jgi:hypothetical protein
MFITKKEHDDIKERLDRIESALFKVELSFTKGFENKLKIEDIAKAVDKLSQLAEIQGYEYIPEVKIPAGWVRRKPKKK